MGVRLPAEYQEVEYIKVDPYSGNQYIDTRIAPKQNATRWEFKIKFDNITSQATSLMGSGWLNGQRFNFRVFNNKFSAAFGDSFIDFGVRADNSIVHTVVINSYLSRYAELDGVRVTDTANPEYSENKSIFLFARNRSGGIDYYCKATIYSSKIWENGDLIQDLVPCYRKSDSKPGMYDLVTKQFFTNQGTGEFLVGPDVIDSISPLMVAWRRGLMMRKPPVEYIPDVVDGIVHPIEIAVYTGQKVKIYWSDVTQNDYTTELYRLINGAAFVETSVKSSTTSGIGQSGERRYTIASNGSIIVGGRIPYPNTLWNTYAMHGKVGIVIT